MGVVEADLLDHSKANQVPEDCEEGRQFSVLTHSIVDAITQSIRPQVEPVIEGVFLLGGEGEDGDREENGNHLADESLNNRLLVYFPAMRVLLHANYSVREASKHSTDTPTL